MAAAATDGKLDSQSSKAATEALEATKDAITAI